MTIFICNHALPISITFAMPVAQNYFLEACRPTLVIHYKHANLKISIFLTG